MKARDMIAALSQLDPDTEITRIEPGLGRELFQKWSVRLEGSEIVNDEILSSEQDWIDELEYPRE